LRGSIVSADLAMSYTVLARKYRPQTFADLVGQEHVSRTIGNAIEGGRVAHAFLFTGARGVGKTTTARLLAKALNCERGPTPTPCNACDACREIAAGTDLDVLEIDGASNNGVDDVRRLQETLPFRPARDRFKIVIVDEVHMLSTGAFNAFLKTLEEPPAHVKFIFATTESHKVPITIRSRCQRYDFRLIPHAVVASRVREILALEHIEADDGAVALVAREAAGSMRDALTVLDQLLALGGTSLRGESVARGLGIADRDHVFGTVEALLAGDAAECLRRLSGVVEQGLDTLHFAKQLLECVRDLVVLRVVGAADAHVELAPDELKRAQQLSQSKERPELERLFAGLAKLVEEVGEAGLPQMTLEMGLVRLADRPPLIALQELVSRLKGLEEKLGGGQGGGSQGGGAGSAPRTPFKRGPGSETGVPRTGRLTLPDDGLQPTSRLEAGVEPSTEQGSTRLEAPATYAPVTHTPVTPPVTQVERTPVTQVERDEEPSSKTAPVGRAGAFRASHDEQRSGPVPADLVRATYAPAPTLDLTAPRTAKVAADAPPTHLARDDEHPGTTLPAGAARSATHGASPTQVDRGASPTQVDRASPTQVDRALPTQVDREDAGRNRTALAPTPHAASAADEASATLDMQAAWPRIVNQIKLSQPALGAVLDHGTPLEVTSSALRIGFPEGSFFGRQAQSTAAREAILRAAEQVFGARPTFTISVPGNANVSTLAESEETARRTRKAARREVALRHPSVVDAMEVFEESEGSVDVHVDLE
jgi:DNA polymerase-3 subunit gamma/tau